MDRYRSIVRILIGAIVVVLIALNAEALVTIALKQERAEFWASLLDVVLVLATILLVDRLVHPFFGILRDDDGTPAQKRVLLQQERQRVVRILRRYRVRARAQIRKAHQQAKRAARSSGHDGPTALGAH